MVHLHENKQFYDQFMSNLNEKMKILYYLPKCLNLVAVETLSKVRLHVKTPYNNQAMSMALNVHSLIICYIHI